MKFGKYRFSMTLTSDAWLPGFKGSTIRGLLGHALKRTVCALKHQNCPSCILKRSCTYALAFETVHALPCPENKRISAPPHPMVIEPPLTEKTHFAAGDTLTCTLILLGDLNRHLPYFIYAFDQMGSIGMGKKINGRRAGFVLDRVTFEEKVVYSKNSADITLPDHLPRLSLDCRVGTAPGRITLNIKTPLRISAGQNRMPALPFEQLARALVRRCTALANTYGCGEPDLDYPGLIQAAARIKTVDSRLSWFDWLRYSSRQDKKMFMGGLVGTATFEGAFEPFMPFLSMAEQVHAGKNTSFGLGKIKLEAMA